MIRLNFRKKHAILYNFMFFELEISGEMSVPYS